MMETRSRPELYREFLEFVRKDLQGQRKTVTRRIFNVFLWCFLIPATLSLILLTLVRFSILPRSISRYMDWLILVFPILYSIYILSIEVLSEMPLVFRRGGIGTTLAQAGKDCEWRSRNAAEMRKAFSLSLDQWRWISANFAVDLKAIHHRAKYLTGLAGAVFFLLMQGIDQLGDPDADTIMAYQSLQNFVQASTNNVAQFIGLALFLVLLYLSGTQTYHSLKRYQDCVELLLLDLQKELEPEKEKKPEPVQA